jgi:hypothetical protein
MSSNGKILKQFLLTPAAGKRLIAKSIMHLPEMEDALKNRRMLIVGGTTNSYLAEEILSRIGQLSGFRREGFFRGITFPPDYKMPGDRADGDGFIGDVFIDKGQWIRGKTVFDVIDSMEQGDIVFKGANALNIENRQAAIYIGHPKGGTISAILEAVIGRRVSLYIPVGLEKRVPGDLNRLARIINAPNASGTRLMPVSGEIITELDAIRLMTGAEAELIAGGGVCGAEGSCWLGITGSADQVDKAEEIIRSIRNEPGFNL